MDSPTKASNKDIFRPHDPEQAVEELRRILLGQTKADLAELARIINSESEWSERVDPIIARHIEVLKSAFPQAYEQAVIDIVNLRMPEMEEELINTLYPMLGKMIRSYVQLQIKELRENIDQRVQQSFVGRIRTSIQGKSAAEIIVSANESEVEEFYVIERDSGLLKVSAAKEEQFNADVIGGMLTAIKSFAEDAFQQDNELSSISYEDYHILLFPFHRYYTAAAVKGGLTASQEKVLQDRILDFAQQHLRGNLAQLSPAKYIRMRDAIMQAIIEKPLT